MEDIKYSGVRKIHTNTQFCANQAECAIWMGSFINNVAMNISLRGQCFYTVEPR